MRRIGIIGLILWISFTVNVSASGGPNVSARNAVLIEQSTGRILYEKKAHEERLIASITKIMTAILAVESGKMDKTVTVSKNAAHTEGSSVYLEEGEKIKLKDLVYGLMLRSGNDAAVAIAEYLGGSVEGFSYLMNEKAAWIGMQNSSFDNPHGLDSETHYSTAYDMALLMKHAMDNDTFREISGTEWFKSENRTYSWKNKNKLLTSYYEYCTGGKTGYTRAAGRTLVSSAHKDGMDLIAVTLNAPDDWNDHQALFEWGFKNFELETLQKEGELPEQWIFDNQTAYFPKTQKYPLTREEVSRVEAKWIPQTDKNSDILGRMFYELDDQEIASSNVVSTNPKYKNSIMSLTMKVFFQLIGVK